MIAFFEALKSMLPAGITCHVVSPEFSTPVAMNDFPYVVLWGSPGTEFSGEPDRPDQASLRDSIAGTQLSIKATYAGLSPDSMLQVLSDCRKAWNRQRPVVAGFACEKLVQNSLQDLQPDESLKVGSLPALFAVDEYTLLASSL